MKSLLRLVVNPFSSILFFFFIMTSHSHFKILLRKNIAFGLEEIFLAAVPKADIYILVPCGNFMLLKTLAPTVGKLSGNIIGNGNKVGFVKPAVVFKNNAAVQIAVPDFNKGFCGKEFPRNILIIAPCHKPPLPLAAVK